MLSDRVVSPSPDDGDQICVAEMQRLLAKVSEMCSQRATLSESLRRTVHADDVTTALVTHAGANKDVRRHRVVTSSCRRVVASSRLSRFHVLETVVFRYVKKRNVSKFVSMWHDIEPSIFCASKLIIECFSMRKNGKTFVYF